MAEHEQEFVEYVVKALVEKPDAVAVKRSLDEKGVFLELTVDPEDVGKVIGKKGATINALRALLRVLGAKYDARYSLKVIEPEGFRDDRPSRDEAASQGSNESNDDVSATEVSETSTDEHAPSEHEMPDPAAVDADISVAETATAAEPEADAEESSEVDDIKARAQEGLEDLDDFAV